MVWPGRAALYSDTARTRACGVGSGVPGFGCAPAPTLRIAIARALTINRHSPGNDGPVSLAPDEHRPPPCYSDIMSIQQIIRAGFLAGVCGLVCTVPLLGGCTQTINDNDIKPVSLTDVRSYTGGKNRKAVLVLDPRTPDEYRAAH